MNGYYVFLKQYEKYNVCFLDEIKVICDMEYGIPYYNTLEHRILLYEVIGRLSTFGVYSFFKNDTEKFQLAINTTISLINNNLDFKYPVYDNQIIELSILFLLLLRLKKYSDIKNLLAALVSGIECNYIYNHKYPAPNDQYDEALLIEMNEDGEAYRASVLFGGLIEWVCLIDDAERYNELIGFIKKHFPEMTCQTWQVNHIEEMELYNKEAPFDAGASVILNLDIDITKQKEDLLSYNGSVQFEKFSFNDYSFPAISIIASRYFNYPILPQFWRIKIKKD